MRRLSSLVHQFFLVNKRICDRIRPHLPHYGAHLGERYVRTVAGYLNSAAEGAIVLDVGGGKSCAFANGRGDNGRAKIIAVDISKEELRYNRDVDGRLVADIVRGLPFPADGVDMIVSRSVMEHLRRTEDFIVHASQVLKPGGHFVHFFPNRFAPFALLNRMLPERVSARIVHFFRQGSEGRLGFPAYYDQCYPDAMSSLLSRSRLEIVEMRVSYYQSGYFEFFVPLFLLSVVYELIVYGLGARNLGAYVLLVARKELASPSSV